MRRVREFIETEKSACAMLNEWLEKNPEATLIDIKVVISEDTFTTIYAIVEIRENTKEEKTV